MWQCNFQAELEAHGLGQFQPEAQGLGLLPSRPHSLSRPSPHEQKEGLD